jgi:hypothetical protein
MGVFGRAFENLHLQVPQDKVRQFAVTIQGAMTAHTRYYHTLNHIFSLVAPDDPVSTLAGLYHDIVYYQVDQQFTAGIEELVSPYVELGDDGSAQLGDVIPERDKMVALALEIFDLQPRQKFAAIGALNEFLSAVVMIKQLEEFLAAKELILITAMIEATIPFRGRDAQGRTHFQVLVERLRGIGRRCCDPPYSEDELEAGIKRAVLFANKDIDSFAEPDPGHFLDNTWKLLPETNPYYLVPNIYTIRSYRQALQQMQEFLCRLNPGDIFSSYHGTPAEADFNRIVGYAHVNLRLGCEYLKIRIVAISLLEALAEVSGGDTSMRLFLADLPSDDGHTLRFDNFLPVAEPPSWVDTSSTIYRLLSQSRDSDWGFDRVTSPLSLFVYLSLTPEGRMAAFDLARGMFDGRISADEFLRRMDPGVVSSVARASAEIVHTRREQLMGYAKPSPN